MSAGQTTPNRELGYNKTYWAQVEKDINKQEKTRKHPSRSPKGKPLPESATTPYAIGGENKAPDTFGKISLKPRA